MSLKENILKLKNELDITVVAHHYQKDDVVEIADFVGDSLELAQIASRDKKPNLLFCGVGFMGQSVKILDPKKRVFMPRIACCAMARMIDETAYDKSVQSMVEAGIDKENIMPITYINSSAEVKAQVGKMNGYVCTSANASKIISKALKSGKKILFVPDRCLGENIAIQMGLKSAVIGIDKDIQKADIICFNGFCSVHQLFTKKDIDFFRNKYENIIIVSHPECDTEVCNNSDFVGSTSQIIKYVKSLPLEQKIAVGTEFNMVKRMRSKNTFILSSTKPECPTMNETTLQEVYDTLVRIKEGKTPFNEVFVDEEIIENANKALNRMFEIL